MAIDLKTSPTSYLFNAFMNEVIDDRTLPVENLQRIIEADPLIGMMLMDRSGWQIDHAFRKNMSIIIEQSSSDNSDQNDDDHKFRIEMAINNSALLFIRAHESFRERADNGIDVPFRISDEVLVLCVDHGYDLITFQNLETKLQVVTTRTWADHHLDGYASMLTAEGYDIDVHHTTGEINGNQCVQTWLVHHLKDDNYIVPKYTSTVVWRG